jgi:hypothetical protein
VRKTFRKRLRSGFSLLGTLDLLEDEQVHLVRRHLRVLSPDTRSCGRKHPLTGIEHRDQSLSWRELSPRSDELDIGMTQ